VLHDDALYKSTTLLYFYYLGWLLLQLHALIDVYPTDFLG